MAGSVSWSDERDLIQDMKDFIEKSRNVIPVRRPY